MNDLKVYWWPIDKPIAYARNSRKIPECAIDKVAASIKEFGWRQAIVVDKDGVIICGHTRLLAAQKWGYRWCRLESCSYGSRASQRLHFRD